jgi:hypothetical protein
MRALILSIVLALPMLAADMTTLTISVKSPGGKPVENASVIVKFVKGRSKAKFGKKIRLDWELRSNQEGLAKIPPIPQGTILVQIIAKDYAGDHPQSSAAAVLGALTAPYGRGSVMAAMTSISTLTSRGSLAACTVDRAGGSLAK